MMKLTTGLTLAFLSLPFGARAEMPRIQPKKTYTVRTAEEGQVLLEQRGFGDQESQVRMMNLMMVEGSGLEGMDMSQAKSGDRVEHDLPGAYLIESKLNPPRPTVGSHQINLVVRHRRDQSPAPGLKLKAAVFMTSMDMGTENPSVKEVRPGEYQLKASFSMQGPWALKIVFSEGGEQTLRFDVTDR
jgi:hypothetical protein